jgi:hypothetical protein
MATIAVQVQSMLNTAVYDTYVTSDTVTVQTLKNYIYANASVSAAWYQLYYRGEMLANANTLASYGIGNVQIRSGNKIGDLPTREDRQKAKLDLAALDRIASGNPRDTYDITELPTQYSGNTVVDNANLGGLVEGRPWSAQSVVTTNLVLNLDPDNASSYPGSGTTWNDLAGTAQNLTLYGSPTYTSGTPSYFTFNGTSQYALSGATGIVNTTAYTKSAWFYLNGYQDNNIFSGDGHFIYMGPQANIDRKIYSGHSNWGSFTAYPSTATINLNTWYNVTLTFSTANGMTLYINGVQDSTYTVQKTAHPGTGSASIAAYVSGNLLKGRVGKVLCYSAELSAADVLQNFNATKATYGL